MKLDEKKFFLPEQVRLRSADGLDVQERAETQARDIFGETELIWEEPSSLSSQLTHQ